MPRLPMASLPWRAFEICWKSTLVLLLWAAIDYLLQRQKMERDLRMSKQELRDEYKETDGHPSIRRGCAACNVNMRRRRMLKEVEHATPGHHQPYALCSRPGVPAGDGRRPWSLRKPEHLAEQIKEIARWHEIPMRRTARWRRRCTAPSKSDRPFPPSSMLRWLRCWPFIYRAQMRAQQAAAEQRA